MATRMGNCKRCRASVVYGAAKCDQCGVQYPTVPTWAPAVVIGAIALIAIIVAGVRAAAPPTAPRATAAAPAAKEDGIIEALGVTAAELWQSYHANEVAADAEYRDKWLMVDGQAVRVAKDAFDGVRVELASPNEFMPIHASVRTDAVAVTAQIQPGMALRMMCKGGGMVLGVPILKECSFPRDRRR
jgi:hypothetical protein